MVIKQFALIILAATLWTLPASGETIRGIVMDASSNEPLASVRVSAAGHSTSTGTDGRFLIEGLPSATLSIQFAAVNYGILKQDVDLRTAGTEIEVHLHQDAASISTRIDVTASVFEGADGEAAASQQTLSKNELQSLGTNIVADPLRAVQALPSVTTTNDARGEISIRGSSFDRVAVLVDGILVDGFLHQAQGDRAGNETDRASFSILSTDRIASATVLSGALPAKYGQRTAGVVAFDTREGNHAKANARITTGFLLGTSIVVDGPLARKKASYLIGVRSSAIDYLNKVAGATNSDTTVFNDGQTKFVFDLSSHHKLTASSFFGTFRDDTKPGAVLPLGRNTANHTRAFSLAAILGWDWSVRPNLVVQTKLFHLETNLRSFNMDRLPLSREPRRQWGWRQDSALALGRNQLGWGTYVREIEGEGFEQQFIGPAQRTTELLENYRGKTLEKNFYVQDTHRIPSAQLALTGGIRMEQNSLTKETVIDPRLALAWGSSESWQLRAGYSRQHQFPELAPVLSLFGNRTLRAEESRQASLTLERSLGERARFSAELFDRKDRKQIFALEEPRFVNGVIAPVGRPQNSVSGYARGMELMLQRRSANRLSGWLSYSYLFTKLSESSTGLRFPADADQRNGVRAYGNYRLGSSWNFSSLWRYGSGQPLTGFFVQRGSEYFLGSQRNAVRLPAYSRLDLRLSKELTIRRTQWTFAVEGGNILNRRNLAFNGIQSIDANGKVKDPTTFFLARFITIGLVVQF